MAKPAKEPEPTLAEKLEKDTGIANTYIAKIKDKDFAAIQKANEVIKYNFQNLGDPETADKYIDTLYSAVKKGVEKIIGGKLKDDPMADSLVRSLGGVTRDQIEKLVKSKGGSITHDDLVRLITSRHEEFVGTHYQTVSSKHIKTTDDIKEAIEYLGLKGKVDEKLTSHGHIHQFFSYKGVRGDIPDAAIPHEIRAPYKKPKKK